MTQKIAFEGLLLLIDITKRWCVVISTVKEICIYYIKQWISLSEFLLSFILEKCIVCDVCGLRSPSFEFTMDLCISHQLIMPSCIMNTRLLSIVVKKTFYCSETRITKSNINDTNNSSTVYLLYKSFVKCFWLDRGRWELIEPHTARTVSPYWIQE